MNNFLRVIVCLAFVMCSLEAISQRKDSNLDKNTWHDYEGTLKGVPIQMSLYFFDNDSIKGNYVYKNEENKISLSGRIINGRVELIEWFNNQPNGYFVSTRWQTYHSNLCKGTWTDTSRNKNFEFELQATGSVVAKYDHRYADFSNDTVLETFMKKVKYSIIYEDRDWLAENISYPIEVHTHSLVATEPKTLEIRNKHALMEKYDVIFNTTFKNKVRNDVPVNLWGNYMGYMLGNGDIWVTPEKDGSKIKITAINN